MIYRFACTMCDFCLDVDKEDATEELADENVVRMHEHMKEKDHWNAVAQTIYKGLILHTLDFPGRPNDHDYSGN